jgi:hypothetical protein
MDQNNLQAEALRRVPALRNDTAATKSSGIFGMLVAAAARCDGALRLAFAVLGSSTCAARRT